MSKGIYVILTRGIEADNGETMGLDGQTYPQAGLARFLDESKMRGSIGDVINHIVNLKSDQLNAAPTTREEELIVTYKAMIVDPKTKIKLGKNGVYENAIYELSDPISKTYSMMHRHVVNRGPQSGEYKTLDMMFDTDFGGGRK